MNFNCYIDEAGDEGINTGGSRWFLIGGVLVRKADDLAISRAVDRVKALIGQRDGRKPLHWRELNRSHNKRLAVMREFGDLPFDFVLCAVDKDRLVEKKVFKQKQRLYNYLTRILVERISWRVRDLTDGKGYADLYFESRSNMSYRALEDYLERVKADPSSELVANVIGKPIPRTGQECKNLQIVDACAGACFAALEPNDYGMTDQSYVTFLRERFYRRKGNLSDYGFKLLPHDGAAEFAGDNMDQGAINRESEPQAPGSHTSKGAAVGLTAWSLSRACSLLRNRLYLTRLSKITPSFLCEVDPGFYPGSTPISPTTDR